MDGKNVDKSFIDTRLLMNDKIPSYDQMIKNMADLIKENSKSYKNYKL